MEEIWKEVPSYSNYEVSNFGRLKSKNYNKTKYERIMKPLKSNEGYINYILAKDGYAKTYKAHILIGIVFLGYIPNKGNIVIDHIDNDKTNNRLDNLQIITFRENLTKDRSRISGYRNVYKHRNKWRVVVNVKGKRFRLGLYATPEEGSVVAEKFLKTLQNG